MPLPCVMRAGAVVVLRRPRAMPIRPEYCWPCQAWAAVEGPGEGGHFPDSRPLAMGGYTAFGACERPAGGTIGNTQVLPGLGDSGVSHCASPGRYHAEPRALYGPYKYKFRAMRDATKEASPAFPLSADLNSVSH